ncbi:MAG: hypothetical protein HY462_01710 [Parcubacteria group bacterium]|nr:hypothetical protein [Parcubacteria group bacterium]
MAMAALLLMGLVLAAPPPVMATGSAQIGNTLITVTNDAGWTITLGPTPTTAPNGTLVTIRDAIPSGAMYGLEILVSFRIDSNPAAAHTWRAVLSPTSDETQCSLTGLTDANRRFLLTAAARSAPINFLRSVDSPGAGSSSFSHIDVIAGGAGRGVGIWHPLRA